MLGVTLAIRIVCALPFSAGITARPVVTAAIPVNDAAWARRSAKSGLANGQSATFRARRSPQMIATRSASRYGRGCRSTALTTLKMVDVAPMPSASVPTARTVNSGVCRSVRQA